MSHESNLRNGCFTSIDELLADERAAKVKSQGLCAEQIPVKPCQPSSVGQLSLRRISKLTFNTFAGRKAPLHLSQIIHIDLPYGRDKNAFRNKKRALGARFLSVFTNFYSRRRKHPVLRAG